MTEARRTGASPDWRSLASAGTAAAVLSDPARCTASSATSRSLAPRRRTSSEVLAAASRSAADSSSVRTLGVPMRPSQPKMVPNALTRSCSNRSFRSACGGRSVALVERLQELRDRGRFAHAIGERQQQLALLRGDLAGADGGHVRFAQEPGHRAQLSAGQHVDQHAVEDLADFVADRRVGLLLEDVEEDRDDVLAQVGGVVLLDRLLEVLDLALVEEVERGVEVIHAHDADGRDLLLRRFADRGRVDQVRPILVGRVDRKCAYRARRRRSGSERARTRAPRAA